MQNHDAIRAAMLFGALAGLPGVPSVAATLTVCPTGVTNAECRYTGDLGIQAAVDAATDGDTIRLRAGRYAPAGVRDVPYKEVRVRGYVVVDDKRLTLEGETGSVLDGSTGRPATAIVVRGGELAIRQLEITGFRYDVEEDDIYEGHGVFVIDGRVRLEDVTIRRFQKMGLTGRGRSLLDATRLRLLDGHVGVWLEEFSHLRLHDAIVSRNDSAAIAAYGRATVHASNCAFTDNQDDGLYAKEQAAIFATNSLVLRNRPTGANAVGQARIWLGYSVLQGNAKAQATSENGQVLLGPEVSLDDPSVDAAFPARAGSVLIGHGDADFGEPPGTRSTIGPGIVP
jgi:hypothetical protein